MPLTNYYQLFGNTLQDTFLFECTKEAGKAAIGGEKRKDLTYEKLLRNFS